MLTAFCAWLDAHHNSCADLVYLVSGVLYVVLAMRQRISAWPVGLFNASVGAYAFGTKGYYSDTALQAYYFVTSIYGWYHWQRGGQDHTELRIGRAIPVEWMKSVSLGILGYLVLGALTSRIKGVAIPWVDAVPVTLSLIAQWMTARKLLENWIVWIVANAIYVVIFTVRHDLFFAAQYLVFLVLAVLGYLEWKRSFDRTSSASS